MMDWTKLLLVGLLVLVIGGIAWVVRQQATSLQPSLTDRYCAAGYWPANECQWIRERKLWAGMTLLQARASWGEPVQSSMTLTDGGLEEEWVYASGTRLFFLAGVLVWWRE